MQTRVTTLGAGEGTIAWLGGFGIRQMIPGGDSAGAFSLVEHPLKPRALAAPMHRHSREDEYSYILRGRVGASLGGEIVYGTAGDLIYKPRNQWHTFWNAGDEDASLLEIISPAGFEKYFEELASLAAAAGGRPEPARLAPLAARYGLELDASSIPGLCADHGLTFG
jgi:quercetin dioxygenase-like cupin family protein